MFVRDIPRRKFLEMSLKGGILVAATPALMTQLVSCSGASPGLDIDRETLSKVLAKALAKGGDFADVYIESRTSRQIVMQESRFRSGLYGISQGAGVRVISGNQTGYAYTDEITPEKLMRAAEVASYVAQGGVPVAPVNLTTPARDNYITVQQPLGEIADEKRIEIIERAK